MHMQSKDILIMRNNDSLYVDLKDLVCIQPHNTVCIFKYRMFLSFICMSVHHWHAI